MTVPFSTLPTRLSPAQPSPSIYICSVLCTHHERLPQCEVGEEDVILEDIADLPLEVLVEGLSVQQDLPGVWLQPAGQHVQQRGLTGTCPTNLSLSLHSSTTQAKL